MLLTFFPLLFLQVRDEVFDREEKLFRGLEKAVRQLVKNVQCYLQHTQVAAHDHFPPQNVRAIRVPDMICQTF